MNALLICICLLAADDCPQVVRVYSGNSIGSGFIIHRADGFARVATAAHVLETSAPAVRLHDGRELAATVIASDRVQDVAVLRVPDPGIPPVDFARGPPAENETYHAGGYSEGRYGSVRGRFVCNASPDGGSPTWVHFTARTRDGMSGGPIWRAGGVVGMVTTCNASGCYGPAFPRLRGAIRGALFPYGRAVVVQPPASPRVRQGLPPPPRCGPGGCTLPPPQQTSPAPTPLPNVPDPPTTEIKIDYDRIAALVYERILDNPEPFRGPAGQDANPTLAPNIDEITAAVVKRLPPIYLKKGEDEKKVYLGGTLPPVVLQIHKGEEVTEQARRLGEPIKIRLSERK